jgi:hypothetical protein
MISASALPGLARLDSRGRLSLREGCQTYDAGRSRHPLIAQNAMSGAPAFLRT